MVQRLDRWNERIVQLLLEHGYHHLDIIHRSARLKNRTSDSTKNLDNGCLVTGKALDQLHAAMDPKPRRKGGQRGKQTSRVGCHLQTVKTQPSAAWATSNTGVRRRNTKAISCGVEDGRQGSLPSQLRHGNSQTTRARHVLTRPVRTGHC